MSTCFLCRVLEAENEFSAGQSKKQNAFKDFCSKCTQLVRARRSRRRLWKGYKDVLKTSALLKINSEKFGLGKQRLTLPMVDAMEPLSDKEWEMLRSCMHLEEYTVVAWLMWWRLLPEEDEKFVEETGLRYIAPDDIPELKSELDALRLCDSSQGDEAVRLARLTRKLTQLAGRDLQEADWAQDLERTSNHYTARELGLPPGLYMRLFLKHATHTISQMMMRARSHEIPTLEEWWDKRAMSTPSGSTSNRHYADKYKSDLHASSDRANKRVVYAMMPDNFPRYILTRTPHIKARCSTKHEPGRKQRALYAACDPSTIVSSYASYGLEKCMDYQGMVARQKPSDVINWISVHKSSVKAGGYWFSLDYTDFNKEHRWYEQCILNLLIAKEWVNGAHHNSVAILDKFECALWTARSYRNRTAKIGSENKRINHGLFSGERNTARDNTLLHAIYRSMIQELYQMVYGTNLELAFSTICGDDEDSLLCKQEEPLQYYAITQGAGWHLNPAKQLVSKERHEFLQYECYKEEMPSQPLVSAVVAFVDGSWYKEPVMDIGGLPGAVMANVQALVARGARVDRAMWAGHKYLNSIFRYVYKENMKWDTLLPENWLATPLGKAFSPQGNSAETQSTTDPKLNKAIEALPSHAVQKLIDRNWDLLQYAKEGRRKAAVQDFKMEVYGSWFSDRRRKVKKLPLITKGYVIMHPPERIKLPTLDQVLEIGAHNGMARSGTTKTQAAAIVGLPLQLFSVVDIQLAAANGVMQAKRLMALVDEETTSPVVIRMRNNYVFNFPF